MIVSDDDAVVLIGLESTLRFETNFFFLCSTVMQDELETAMRNVGITSLDEASPDLVHTGDVDHLVPASRAHPYARAIAKGRRDSKI